MSDYEKWKLAQKCAREGDSNNGLDCLKSLRFIMDILEEVIPNVRWAGSKEKSVKEWAEKFSKTNSSFGNKELIADRIMERE